MTIIIYNIIALFLASIIFGILGSFVIWKRYTYFGDGLSHAMILGITLSYLTNYNLVILFAIFFALTIIFFNPVSRNSLIGMMSQAFVSCAIIIKAFFNLQIDLETALFGDVLLTDASDIFQLTIFLFLLLIWIKYAYKDLLLSAMNNEISKAYLVNNGFHEKIFPIIIAIAIAFSIKIFGALMVTSLLLIPGINAKIISMNPKQMIVNSVIISMVMNFSGLVVSYKCNLPISPVTILVGIFLFFIFQIFYRKGRI
jgi:zinc transport system permease protein